MLVAAAIRLFGLGDQPLLTGEANSTLQSWQLAQGHAANIGAGPIMIYGNALIFFAFGANDVSARFLPAIAGILLTAAPFLLRRELGRSTALIAAALIAFSPTLGFFSRLSDSHSVLALAALVTGIGIFKFSNGYHKWLTVIAVSLAVVLLTGRDLYSALLALIVASAIVLASTKGPTLTKSQIRTAVWLFAGILVLGLTGLLTYPHGIQDGLVQSFDEWRHFSLAPQDLFRPTVMLLVYEPLLLVFAVVGAIGALRRGSTLIRFLTWWSIAGFVLCSLTGESNGSATVILLAPLCLLAGHSIDRAVGQMREVSQREIIGYSGTVITLLTLFWITSEFFTLPGSVLPSTVHIGGATVALQALSEMVVRGEIVVILAAVFGLAFWLRGIQLVAVAALVVLTLVTIHASMLLNFGGSPAELQFAKRTSPDVRTMAREIADDAYALAAANRPHDIKVAADDPILRWYLRQQPATMYRKTPGQEAIVLAPADLDPPPGRFVAQQFRLSSVWSGETSLGGWWRWLTLREATGLRSTDLVVYIRMPES